MPGRSLDNGEVTGIIAYVRNMRDFEVGSVTLGDVNRGQAAFEGEGSAPSVVGGRHLGSRRTFGRLCTTGRFADGDRSQRELRR